MVYVQNKDGQPLMPTERYGKVRRLLNTGKAKVIKRCPFTIRLLYVAESNTQPITLGVDAGSKHIGLSATTEHRELFAGQAESRNNVTSNLKARREFRRARRNRKTRYRKPRFDNRIRSKNKGWLAPSVEVKIQNHISAIKLVCSILPISKVVVETAEFDLQALKAELEGKPMPQGKDYQRGEMFGFYNTRQYTLFRDSYTCRVCGNSKGKLCVVSADGKDTLSPTDSYTVCESCLKKHYGKGALPFKKRRYFTHPTFMGIMRKTLLQRLRTELNVPVMETLGAVTKETREHYGIEKSHIADARCISQNPMASPLGHSFLLKPIRQHNRQLHKATILRGGIRKLNQLPTYIYGYRLYDRVLYNNQECFIWGRRTSGSFVLKTLDGKTISAGVTYKKIKLLERSKNIVIERKAAFLPIAKARGFQAA